MNVGGTVVSVNVGAPKNLLVRGRPRVTGIFKEPVTGRVPVRGVAVGSDVQIEKDHGGPFKAVYVYAAEDYEWWSSELGTELLPGTFGENITTRGVDVSGALIGERWRIGTAVIEVTDPRIPCSTLGGRMGIKGFVKRFAAAERFGAYCGIAEEGDVGAGDPIALVYRPPHGITIVDVARAYYSADPDTVLHIYEATGRPRHYASWVEKVTAS